MAGNLQFPRWVPRANPTPPEGIACDLCNVVEWSTPQQGRVFYHSCGARFRPLTPQETEALKAHVKTLEFY